MIPMLLFMLFDVFIMPVISSYYWNKNVDKLAAFSILEVFAMVSIGVLFGAYFFGVALGNWLNVLKGNYN